MSIEQAIIHKLRSLPADKQQELLDFADFLYQKVNPHPTFQSVRGIYKDLDIRIDEAAITEARQEMWSGFPREIGK